MVAECPAGRHFHCAGELSEAFNDVLRCGTVDDVDTEGSAFGVELDFVVFGGEFGLPR